MIGYGLLGAVYTENLDDLTDAGVYQITASATGKPTSLTDGIGVMLSSVKTSSIGVQLAFGSGGKMFYRYKWTGTWNNWREVTSNEI